MPSSQWVAVCISDSEYVEYFHSYCLPPYKFEIIAFLQRYSISWTFKLHRLQGLTSNFCGLYCCIYALHRQRGQYMTSLANMFVSARYTWTKKDSAQFRAQFREFRLGRLKQQQQSCKSQIQIKVNSLTIISLKSLLVADFTFLEGRDCEVVVEQMAAVDSHGNRVWSCLWEAIRQKWIRLLTTGVTGIMAMYYIQSWRLCYIARNNLPLQSIASVLRKYNLLVVPSTVLLLLSHS